MHVITLNISNLLKKSKHIMKQYLGGSGGGGGSVCVCLCLRLFPFTVKTSPN